jgi:hypothetical protein
MMKPADLRRRSAHRPKKQLLKKSLKQTILISANNLHFLHLFLLVLGVWLLHRSTSALSLVAFAESTVTPLSLVEAGASLHDQPKL